MKVIQIKKIKKSKTSVECSDCSVKATKTIDGVPYCAGCGDAGLLVNAKACVDAVEQVHATISIKLKREKNAREKSPWRRIW